jgi:two-component system alkaline phosphatase synthesis response regulator PhoP
MRRVLLVGGQRLASLQRGLEDDGYDTVFRAPGVPEPGSAPDAIVVEIEAAAEDAEVRDVLQRLSSGDRPAVIALVEPEQLTAFDPSLGLDDFVAATASAPELALRIRQALWRRTKVDARNVLRAGDLEMDLASYTVSISGRHIELTYKEYELLRYLATNADRVLNRETLLNRVWGYDFYGGARTVDVHIRRLRAKIEDSQRTFIETVRNVGYRFRSSP